MTVVLFRPLVPSLLPPDAAQEEPFEMQERQMLLLPGPDARGREIA